jgi:hypothetical protein
MIRRLITPVLILTATLLPAAPAVPLVNLVNDQTMFAVSVSDVPALLRGWDTGPLATTWNDPQVVKFLAPMRAEMKVDQWDDETKAATGLSVRELLALAEGEALLAVPAFDFSKIDSMDSPPFVLALVVGGQADKIQKILADSLAKKNLVETTEEFSGVRVHTQPQTEKSEAAEPAVEGAEVRPPATVSWAIVDGVWVISAEKERVFATIDAVKQGGVDAALGKSERFLRTRERARDAQGLFYVNFPVIYPALRDAVTVAKAKGVGTNPMGLDPETVFAALGLDALGECYLALRIDDTQTHLYGGLVYAEARGLLKMLAYQPGAAVQPDWIPAKWPSVSTARFSISKAYEGLEELLEAVSPMLSGMVQGQIRGLNKNLHIDLKRDLIGSIGDDLVSAYAIPPGLEPGAVPAWTEMDQLMSVSLVNEAAFVKSIDAFKSLAGPAAEQMFLKRDYLGHTLHTLNQPTEPGAKPARGFSYAIANGTLLLGIGSPATVENALQGMAAKEGLFWKRDDVKAALGDLPSDASGLQVQDLRVMMASLVETAVQMQELANAQKPDGEKTNYVDASARPDAGVIARHWGMSGGYVTRTPEGLFSVTRFEHPKK